jgi:4-amino-4-deoxy-L-arabinose transferase-like glycosyltransferase
MVPIVLSSSHAAAYSRRSRTRGLYRVRVYFYAERFTPAGVKVKRGVRRLGKLSFHASLLKTTGGNARLNRLISFAPIRSRAPDEGNFQIPLWSVPLILIVLYVCLFSGLSAFGLVGPDEPRYAAIARAMAETHDWVTPRLWGMPWFEKPVLYYWTAGIAMRIFGVSEFAARLPSALAALLAILAVTWTALRSYGVGTAWYALLMLPTCVATIGFSRAASPDMLFAGLLTAAMAVAYKMLQKPRPGPVLRIAFGFFLGAAVLAKGPAAVILAGGATLLWAWLSRQGRAPFRFLHPLTIVVFCATTLPWYVLCALRNPDFLRIFIWQHNFERYLTPIFEHRQPFWFFGPIFLLGILPWLPLLVTPFFDAARNHRFRMEMDSPGLFIACWALFTLLFFSLSQSKLPGYILPAIPPAVLLLARSFVRQTEQAARGLRMVLAGTGIVVPVLLGVVLAKPNLAFGPGIGVRPELLRGVQFAFGAALVAGGIIVAFALYRKWNGAVCITVCTIIVLLLIANRMIMPELDAFISARPAAAGLIHKYNAKPEEVAVYHLPRAYEFGLNYYFGRDLPEWTPENTRATYLFFSKDSLTQLNQFPQLFNARTSTFYPATPDGKIYLRLGQGSGK